MIRLATIGTSAITERFLAAVGQVDGIEATTAYSRDAGRAAAFAEKHGMPAATADLDTLLAGGTIDAVYVGSPNSAHHAQAERALRAGVHAFIEKPATVTAAEFAGLVELAARCGVVVFEGMRSAYDPAFDVIRELLAEVGVVRRASFTQTQRSARYDRVLAGERVNIFDPQLAGGALNDLGVYAISAMVDLFGEPSEVRAFATPIASGVDGAGTALLRYPGFVADVSYSKITASDRSNEIQGEQGTLTIDRISQPTRLRLRLLDGTVTERETGAGAPDNMAHEVRRFVELVEGRADAASDHARSIATLRVVEAIRRSAAN